jgi:L-seryl-tRNA(Ser) seleniumtransferase
MRLPLIASIGKRRPARRASRAARLYAARVNEPVRPHPPSVASVLELVRQEVEASEPAALTAAARAVTDAERDRLAAGAQPLTLEELADAVVARLEDFVDPAGSVPPHVVNATGVVLHTNLGRAPWPRAARLAAMAAAADYGYLELDEVSGRRGARFRAAEEHLVALTGAEDALVVTNTAAALLLACGLVGRRAPIAVSRGELVEIGGGVRIPEMVARAGARLVEVGTTNRTRTADFEAALAEGRASAVLRVHRSNFTMTGFTESADLAGVAEVAHRHGALVIDDLGSGALLDTAVFGLAHEPTPSERLAAGADVVLFSGDKLVGGPQAGLVVGRRDLVARMRRDPLARAVRPDKAILAGVAATLGLYRAGRAALDIPVWRTIARTPGELRERAAGIVAALEADGRHAARVVELASPVGGGSLPGQVLPSAGVAVAVANATSAAARLRRGPDRVLARVEDDELVVDLRTVARVDDALVARRLAEVAPRR